MTNKVFRILMGLGDYPLDEGEDAFSSSPIDYHATGDDWAQELFNKVSMHVAIFIAHHKFQHLDKKGTNDAFVDAVEAEISKLTKS